MEDAAQPPLGDRLAVAMVAIVNAVLATVTLVGSF
jgi:hypothetical protein